MNNNQGTTSDSYLTEDEIYPDTNSARFKSKISEVYRDIALRVNERQIGTYDKIESNTGKKFFGTAQRPRRKRESLRKVFQIDDSIAAGATHVEAHEITNVNFYTEMYGTAKTDVPDHRPIPYSDPTGTNGEITFTVDDTNITIANGTGGPTLERTTITLEYVKN